MWLCFCAGPFPRCSLCCSHWGGLVVICLGPMLPALHSAPVGPREGRPPSTTAETHARTHSRPHGGFFSFSTQAKHKGRRPSHHRFSLLYSALPHRLLFFSCYPIRTHVNYYICLFRLQQHWMNINDRPINQWCSLRQVINNIRNHHWMLLGLPACRDSCLWISRLADCSNTLSLALCWAMLCFSQFLSCLLTFGMCVGVISAARLNPRSHCREEDEPATLCWFNWLCIMGLWSKYQELLSEGCRTLSCVSTVPTVSPPLLLLHFKAATKQGCYGGMEMCASAGSRFKQNLSRPACCQVILLTVDTLR